MLTCIWGSADHGDSTLLTVGLSLHWHHYKPTLKLPDPTSQHNQSRALGEQRMHKCTVL